MDPIQMHISSKNSYLEIEECCIFVKRTCFFEELGCLFFVRSTLRTCFSNWFHGTPNTFFASQTYYDFTIGWKESSIFTYKFNFDAREDATGVIMILTMQTWTELIELLIQNKITFSSFRTRMQVVISGRVCLVRWEGILTAIQRNTIWLRKISNVQVTLMSGITWVCSLLCFTKEIFPSEFLRHGRKSLLEGVRRLLVRYLTKIHTKKCRHFPV
jgi:hypothetical protein